jgi:Tfp pilus assembly protein PilN
MIQFNLLPDVKLEYIKTQYRKRLVMTISVIASGAMFAIFVLLFLFVRVNQPHTMKDLDKDIDKEVKTLQARPDLDKVLTIQNQLNSLPNLHNDKVFTSRLFDYLTQLTPAEATISNVELDVEAKTITLKGEANDISTVNKFVDTLKFTDYSVDGDDSKKGKAFNNVVLQNFAIADVTGPSGVKTSYEIALVYEEVIFSNTAEDGNAVTNKVKLTVPKIITTRSETQKPSALFQQTVQPKEEDQ